jgi:hypothetical protein
VVDRAPLFLYQSLIWARSLLDLAGRSPSQLVVHAVDGCERGYLDLLTSMGIRVEKVEPFDTRNPYANKLAQLGSVALSAADYVVLCDSDVAFLEDISAYVVGGAIRAKVVDVAQPTLAGWQMIMPMAGVSAELRPAPASHMGGQTYANNFNGGIYVLPRPAFRALNPEWPRWHSWVLDNREAFDARTVKHAMQVGFGLAVANLGLETKLLPAVLNFPTHLPYGGHDRDNINPVVLHFHDRLDDDGLLLSTGMRGVDDAISRVNRLIRQAGRDDGFSETRQRWLRWRGHREEARRRRSQIGRLLRASRDPRAAIERRVRRG